MHQQVAPLNQPKRSYIKRHPLSLPQSWVLTCGSDCSKFLKSKIDCKHSSIQKHCEFWSESLFLFQNHSKIVPELFQRLEKTTQTSRTQLKPFQQCSEPKLKNQQNQWTPLIKNK